MKKKRLFSSFLLLAMACAGGQAAAAAVSGSTVHLLLHHQALSAEVNGSAEPLEAPAQIVDGSFYIPIKWVGDKLGFKAEWNGQRRTVGLATGRAYLEWDLQRGIASVNGDQVPLQETAIVRDGSLLVKLTWVAPYLEVAYVYRPNPSRVELTYVQKPGSAYRESVYPEDAQPNSRPIAKFATDKAVYRIGEPVRYVDLSYDPDAEGLPKYEWSGKKDAFFAPGTYPVSLRVSDGNGNWSDPFTQNVTVIPETFLTASEFPWYEQPAGTMINDDSAEWKTELGSAPELSMVVTRPEERRVLISGENHAIDRTGLIFREHIEGKVRLVSHHANGLAEDVRLAAVIRNPGTSKLAVRVSREGWIAPALFHRQLAGEAMADFLTQLPSERTIEVEPGQSETLRHFAMEPGQGAAGMIDLETDGNAELALVAAKAGEEPQPLPPYPDPAADSAAAGAGRSVSASILLEANAETIRELTKWTTGGGGTYGDQVPSDLGTVYSIRLYRPRKAAIGLRAKGNYADGALKVNGRMVFLPQGGITDQDGALLVYRADGSEPVVEIEWTAAPGSKPPLEWIYYPLKDKN